MTREYDGRTGRPLEGEQEALRTLSDDELEVELLIAAAAPGRMRLERLTRLRAERARRRFIARFPASVR
jgi:hypothetical protein